MEKQFIPYELALKLKELGFDDKSLGFSYMRFNCEGVSNATFEKVVPNYLYKSHNLICTAPLWQQAFDFLVKKCNLDASEYSLEYVENGWLLCRFNEIAQDFDVLLLNEEALKKLIELCQKSEKI